MRFYLGVADTNWYNYLRQINPEDVNFWQPGGRAGFRVIEPGAPFLFKLKAPYNAIGGVGFFSAHSILPISMAWEIFATGMVWRLMINFMPLFRACDQRKTHYVKTRLLDVLC